MPVKKRKYFRKCGHCGCRFEQSDMHRTRFSIAENGWLCDECLQDIEERNAMGYYDDSEF